MSAKRSASPHVSKTDWARVDAHEIQPEEYEELPELTQEMLTRGVASRGGKRIGTISGRRRITLQLPLDVIERWKATGPGWQTRMVELLSKS